MDEKRPTAKTPGEAWEESLPTWQQKVNRSCENWIFAFLVAMLIRHFVVEPFRIPSASMEPTLFGDIGFARSDFVVVDKILSRFRSPQRYDVTVFQFPHPEVSSRGEPKSAYGSDGKRRDNPITSPLMYRSFVKRAIVLPGERFYLANGDLFIEGKEGFAVARKPQDVQDEVWATIYNHGAQRTPEWYVPWQGAEGGTVDNLLERGLALRCTGGGRIAFTQPFRNLYVKPGPVNVMPQLNGSGYQVVDAALDRPLFRYKDQIGNIWNLDDWWVKRVTTADLDSPSHQALLNVAMRERIGDIRIRLTPSEVVGVMELVLSEGTVNRTVLRLTTGGWELQAGGLAPAASGPTSPVGRVFSLANLDDEISLTVDGSEVARIPVAAVDPNVERLAVAWSGEGQLTLASVAIDRDLFYCANGFLLPDSVPVRKEQGAQNIGAKQAYQESLEDSSGKLLLHLTEVHTQMLGHEPLGDEIWRRVGFSPETAITAPSDAYLLCGDNSPMSWDSRNWGFVPAANLRGRVILRIRSREIGGSLIPFLRWNLVD